MDGFQLLGSENCVVIDNHKGGTTAKSSTVRSVARKRLADITNLPRPPEMSSQDEMPQPIPPYIREYIDKLLKENLALTKLVAERNKIIEISAIEFKQLRINLQKLQQQNLQLAQANNLMLVELNSDRDKLKILRHELGCKNGLLKAKNMELEELIAGKDRLEVLRGEIGCLLQESNLDFEEKEKTVTRQETGNEVGIVGCEGAGDTRLCNANKKRKSMIHSLGPLVKQVKTEEKTEKIRKTKVKTDTCQESENENVKAETIKRDAACECSHTDIGDKQVEAEEKAEKKRPCLRRQSARHKPEELETSEYSIEVNETIFPLNPLHEEIGPTSSGSLVRKEDQGNSDPSPENQASRRSSVAGRPSRRAAAKVQSYKEIPLNVKMRRPG